jgi:2-oxoglutarate ferredoxin oxidoreductase subunit gamma
MKKAELRLTGSGGQGVILATIILAEAGFFDKKKVVQSQSYGPEARGGMCKAEVVIDEKPITYTKVAVPNFLLSLTQASFNQYHETVTDDAVVMVDQTVQVPEDYRKSHNVIMIPILETASDVIGNPMSANIVAVGAINEALGLCTEESLEKSVLSRIPKGTEELNIRALHAGITLVKASNNRN